MPRRTASDPAVADVDGEVVDAHSNICAASLRLLCCAGCSFQGWLVFCLLWIFVFGVLMGLQATSSVHGLHIVNPNTLAELQDALANTLSRANASVFDGPGRSFAELGYTARHPVVFIPGILSTGLELWAGEPCASSFFRERIWGRMSMMQQFISDRACWLAHMSLTPEGRERAGVRVRPAMSLEAADSLFPGFWIWGKLISNLARVGYDSNNMFMAAYDWRLAFAYSEERDRYFTKLRFLIEQARATNGGERVVLMGHSLGGMAALYFFQWLESPAGGGLGADWIDEHIHTFVNIGAPLLGAPKALAALVSGEMRDTVQFGTIEGLLLERVIGRADRLAMFRSWHSLASMLPKGGPAVWGDAEPRAFAADSALASVRLLTPAPNASAESTQPTACLAAGECAPADRRRTIAAGAAMLRWLEELAPAWLRATQRYHSFAETPLGEGASAQTPDPRDWTNALAMPLPRAPHMAVLCLYGHGKATERAYAFRERTDDERASDGIAFVLDDEHADAAGVGDHGVIEGDGDGTVPLVSLGYPCASLWRRRAYNPANVTVRTREFLHRPAALDPRGGAGTADHVDIMGNNELIATVIALLASNETGRATTLPPETVTSDIADLARAIDRRLGLAPLHA